MNVLITICWIPVDRALVFLFWRKSYLRWRKWKKNICRASTQSKMKINKMEFCINVPFYRHFIQYKPADLEYHIQCNLIHDIIVFFFRSENSSRLYLTFARCVCHYFAFRFINADKNPIWINRRIEIKEKRIDLASSFVFIVGGLFTWKYLPLKQSYSVCCASPS